MSTYTSQHNVSHLNDRKNERASLTAQDAVRLAIKHMIDRCKWRRVPNCSWKYAVRFNGQLIGWVCGRGVVISTYLDATQVAYGEEIR